MINRLGVCVVNYNAADMTDALVDRLCRLIEPGKVALGYSTRWVVYDNGSTKGKPRRVTDWGIHNERAVGGWRAALGILAEDNCDALWLICNDVQFPDDTDPALPLLAAIDDGYACAHPSYQPGTQSSWLRTMGSWRGGEALQELPRVEWNAPLFTRAFLDAAAMPALTCGLSYGFGVDIYSAHLARQAGLRMCVARDSRCLHQHWGSGYEAGGVQRDVYAAEAAAECERVFCAKFGPNWRAVLWG